MRKFQCLIAILVLSLSAPCAHCDESDAETEALIKKLSSAEFDDREAAAVGLGMRAEKIWPRLEELARSENSEIRTLVRRAMGDAGQRALSVAMEELENKMRAGEQATADEYANVAKLDAAITETDRVARIAIEKRILHSSDGTKFREQKAEEARVAARERHKEARNVAWKRSIEWGAERETLQMRLLQLRQLRISGDIILPAEIAAWTPAKLTFEQRLKCKVDFEFAGKSLTEVLDWMSDACGAEFELSEKAVANGVPVVILSVRDMDASLVAQWIARQARLKMTIDMENERVLIHTKIEKK